MLNSKHTWEVVCVACWSILKLNATSQITSEVLIFREA